MAQWVLSTLGSTVSTGVLIGFPFMELAHANTDAELLAAFLTLEHERLPVFVFGLVEDGIVIAFGATDSFHK